MSRRRPSRQQSCLPPLANLHMALSRRQFSRQTELVATTCLVLTTLDFPSSWCLVFVLQAINNLTPALKSPLQKAAVVTLLVGSQSQHATSLLHGARHVMGIKKHTNRVAADNLRDSGCMIFLCTGLTAAKGCGCDESVCRMR